MLATPRKHGPKKLINTMHVLASICGHIYSATQHAWNIRCKQIDMYERERSYLSISLQPLYAARARAGAGGGGGGGG